MKILVKIRRCTFELKDASGKVVGEYKTDKMVRLTSKIWRMVNIHL